MKVSEVQKVNPTFRAKPIPKNIAQDLKSQLLSKQVNIVDIYCHCSPDEDTVNSMKVMYNWLKRNGKKVRACLDNSETKGLYLNKLLYHFKNINDSKPADKSLLVDFNGKERIFFDYTFNTKKEKNNIIGFDHHEKTETTIQSKNLYIDESAASCCGVIYRFFEAIGENLSKKDLKSLYCGMLSDYKSSKLANIQKTESGYELIKKPDLFKDENSLEVLNKIENSLSEKDKNQVYKHLDILSHLNTKEKSLMTTLVQDISFSTTHDFAYVFIEPTDKQWLELGCDNVKTSAIMKEIRTRAIENLKEDDLFSQHQKEDFEKLKAIAIFYRVDGYSDSVYQVSIHSKDGYAEKLIEKVKEINPNFIGGGHPDRAGGRILSCDYSDAVNMVNDFLKADEELSSK